MDPMFNRMPQIKLPISDRVRNVYLPLTGWGFIVITIFFL